MKSAYNLYTEVPGVPRPHSPVWWDMELPLRTNLNVMDGWVGQYSRWLPDAVSIDEVAIMVPNSTYVGEVARSLADGGWELFNRAEDMVFTNPFNTRYLVGYIFFKHPNYSYRIELMYPQKGPDDDSPGFSPLHQALWYPNGTPQIPVMAHRFPVPHLSYKPDTRGLSARNDYAVEVGRLQDLGFIHAQTCQSTYGHFGYYLHQDALRQLYLKPRVNLRDAILNPVEAS